MTEEHKEHEHGKKEMPTHFYVLVIALVALMAFNQLQVSNLQTAQAEHYSAMALLAAAPVKTVQAATQVGTNTQSGQQQTSVPVQTGAQSNSISLEAIAEKVIPRGVPAVYGAELGVSFDDPVGAEAKLAKLDDGNGMADATMNARYVKIGKEIACEYCCGANALVFDNGQAACGCAHSYAMRGLAKYLISKHGKEYTDDQILGELGKWKIMFFPKQHLQKAIEFATAGKDVNAVDLASNKFRGFKASTAAPQTGGGGSAVANIANLPNQVGGC